MRSEKVVSVARMSAACLFLAIAALQASATPVGAQDGNFLLPEPEIERRLKWQDFQVVGMQDVRVVGGITKRAALAYPDNAYIEVKWRRAEPGGRAFNNQPRYEQAAYELQKLFLEPGEYVVPPTAIRGMTHDRYRELEPNAPATFSRPDVVLFVLQYWLQDVTGRDVFDKDRFEEDSAYARHLANLNILTFLIRHSDSNEGNFLVSKVPNTPRVYAVDNGVAFISEASDRGTAWRRLRVDRLPRATIERLRGVTKERLERTLGVVAQFEVRDGSVIAVEPGPNLDPTTGVRRQGRVIQLGLIPAEIDGVATRLRQLLGQVESERIALF